MKIKCTECKHFKQKGRQQTQGRIPGRKRYFCDKEEARYNFICFGEMTFESYPTIKTTPRWCPIKKEESEG